MFLDLLNKIENSSFAYYRFFITILNIFSVCLAVSKKSQFTLCKSQQREKVGENESPAMFKQITSLLIITLSNYEDLDEVSIL
jgi:hypothetical protein